MNHAGSENELIVAVVAGTLIVFILISFTISQLLLLQKRRHQHATAIKQLEIHYTEELLRSQLEIQEQTFKTISQEIHDNIGQVLTLAKLNLNTVDYSKEEKTKEKIGDARQLVSKAIHDLRDLSKTLNTETIAAIGIIKAIEMELAMLQKTGAVQTFFEVKGVPVRLHPQKELILFRIIQEALHNVIKHAQASAISVKTEFANSRLQLLINDNGCGFECNPPVDVPAQAQAQAHGSGLRNMQSRSKLIGACMHINSTHGNGTQIHIALPLTN